MIGVPIIVICLTGEVPAAHTAESLTQGNGCRLLEMTCTSRPLLALSR